MKELLFEIGMEEVPSGYLAPAAEALLASVKQRLDNLNLACAEPRCYATPRRLAVSFLDVPDRQPQRVARLYGPPKSAATAPDGSFTKAALGFAKSKGASPDALKIGSTDKGEYVYVEINEGGAATIDLLAAALPEIAAALPFPKAMLWVDGEFRFARPIHWIVALFGGEVIPLSLGGMAAGGATRGHRFMGGGPIPVTCRADYLARLRENHVIADMAERRAAALEEARAAAARHGAALVEDEDLANSVACLTEWPHALWGSFAPEYLELPAELLTASMKNHQRMFSAAGPEGKLTNGFIGVSNMIVQDDAVVVAGYRRVLAARLADAKFFFDADRKKRLEDFAARLDGVVYQKKLGTVGEKIARFSALAGHIAAAVKPELAAEVARVARLCKADLETQMVYEFPELQGVMGREYARHQGEPEPVCLAIHEHYKPRFSGDSVAAGHSGAIVGLADRLDTLAGCFGVGLAPTGAADPFALRRAALGVIQTIIEKDYRLNLAGLLDFAFDQLAGKIESPPEGVRAQLLDFFAARLKNLWTAQGAPPDVVDATLAAGFNDLAAARMRLDAMTELKKRDFFEPLATTFKRAANITRGHPGGAVNPALFEADAERELSAAIAGIASDVSALLERRAYLAALEKIAGLRGAVDRLFDSVMVMADDPAVRENRLNLLASLTALFGTIADFSRVEA